MINEEFGLISDHNSASTIHNDNIIETQEDFNDEFLINYRPSSEEDEILLDFFGSDEHQQLMDNIAQALQQEYETDMMNELLPEDEFDWSSINAYENIDQDIICPICRSVVLFFLNLLIYS